MEEWIEMILDCICGEQPKIGNPDSTQIEIRVDGCISIKRLLIRSMRAMQRNITKKIIINTKQKRDERNNGQFETLAL